jgi:hypothetical protein
MKPNEAILVRGAKRFASYSGYARSFKFNGNDLVIIFFTRD